MRVLSILAHPRPDSFCHAIAERARVALSRRGHDVVSCDLYQENFDPILRAAESATSGLDAEAAFDEIVDDPIHDYRADLVRAEGLFVVHPNWWGKPPAILAGWIDRVFVPGVAYRIETGEGMPEGLLNLRAALILNTSNTTGEQEQGMLGDPL
ncbi:MAG: NAD(P)H-dependent oxidoreductase, partial [Rhodospirillaceae bacterium]|nr:NAD(P)H-dependent oxidoreductase [Rhodospirillaceae bacterium]